MRDRAARAAAPLVLAALAAALLLPGLGSYSVVNGDEGYHQAVAGHMVASGDWLTLEFRGQPRPYDTFLNAPTHYWARATIIAGFGDSLVTMRILSALFGIATVVATWALGRRLFGERGGLFAGGVQLTTFQFLYLHGARTGEMDAILSFVFALAALLLLRAARRGRGLLGHHLCLVAIFTMKVPLVLIPAAVEGAWLLAVRRARPLLGRWLALGLAVLPLALAWHVAQALRLGDAAAGTLADMLGHAGGEGGTPHHGVLDNLRWYAGALVFGAQPWIWLAPPALAFGWARARGTLREERALAALYGGGVLVFFALLAKRSPWYVMPAYPFLSAFVGGWLADLWARRPDGLERAALALAGAGVVCAAVPLVVNPFEAPAYYLDMSWHFRAPAGVPALAVFAAVALALGTALGAARVRASRPVAGAAFALVLLVLAGTRVVLPLRHLGHQSAIARLHADLERDRAEGRTPHRPVPVPSNNLMLVRYYFADDYRILLVPGGDGRGLYRIAPKAEPSKRGDPPARSAPQAREVKP